MTSIKEEMFDDSVYIVEINGAGIQSWREYVEQIELKFEFPTSCIDSQDRYLDWMTDLAWIKKERIVLVINNYNQF